MSCFHSLSVVVLYSLCLRGKWKLLALNGKPVELFDVESDPNEQTNVLEDHPDLVASLTAQLNE